MMITFKLEESIGTTKRAAQDATATLRNKISRASMIWRNC
jgi:hypothetical protein